MPAVPVACAVPAHCPVQPHAARCERRIRATIQNNDEKLIFLGPQPMVVVVSAFETCIFVRALSLRIQQYKIRL